MLKRSLIGLVLMASAAASAPAVGAPLAPGARNTVNDYTPVEERRARAAATRQGYRVGRILMAQDGNLNFDATRGGREVFLTVTREGQVYVATWNPPPTPASGAAALAPAPPPAGPPR